MRTTRPARGNGSRRRRIVPLAAAAATCLLAFAPASALAAWTQQSPAAMPSARTGTAFTFGTSNVDVLFGGMSQGWSAQQIDAGSPLAAVSCASTTLCMATDQAGRIFYYNGTTWASQTSNTTNALNAVSCWGTDCTAVGAGGTIDTTVNSGTTWTATTAGSTTFNAVSCNGAKANGNVCVATGAVSGVQPVTYTDYNGGTGGGAGGTTWASETNAAGNNAAHGESCVTSSTNCLTVGANGATAFTTNGGVTWSAGSGGPSGAALNGAACWYDNGDAAIWCMGVASTGSAYGYISATNPTAWTASADVDGAIDLTAISCPDAITTTEICVAVDSTGHALSWSQTANAWSAPIDIDSSYDLTGVSCTSSSFCVAVDDHDHAVTFSPATTFDSDTWQYKASTDTWSPKAPSTNPTGRQGAALTYDHASNEDVLFGGVGSATWGSATSVDAANASSTPSVSCPTNSFCALVDANGYASTYNGSSWSASTDVNGASALRSVSCVSSAFCVAVGAGGNAFIYNGSWSGASNIDGANILTGVSCVTATFCVAVDNANDLFEYTGSWSGAISDGSSGFQAVSCASTTFCEAIDGSSDAWKYTGGSWAAGSWSETTSIDAKSEKINAISCPSSSFCMAVDNASASDGDALLYNGTGWTTWLVIDGTEALNGVSCMSSTFCVATDANGHVLTWDGLFWSAANDIDGARVVGGASCSSTAFCVVGDESGNALVYSPTYDGDTWQYQAGTDIWTAESPATKPTARSGAALAYDSASGTDVLFGGIGSGGYDGDTWQYTASTDTWTLQSPASAPSARAGASLGYDSDTGLFVLFGGQGANGYDGDTWLYNASTDVWTQQSPSTSPPARAYAGTAATPTELLIDGGASSSGDLSDLWAFYGGNWVQQSPASFPSPRDTPAMAYDSSDGAAVLFGGEYAYGGFAMASDTWLGTFTTLGVLTPATLAWSVTLNGSDQTSDQPAAVTVDDTAGAGWNVDVSATTLTSGANTLPALILNGSSGSAAATTAPTTSCAGGVGTCSAPAGNSITYPLTVPTGTPAPLYTSNSASGTDDVSLALDWWTTTPANVPTGTYTNTITIAVASGP